ncbi:hypothetical protein F5Y19DRAFT_478660 [Xylariaceae sp. FL1651]|nr:hypothetical protein F5Y19DRAFT_478660 [Xylariaceae sp. FL1651]
MAKTNTKKGNMKKTKSKKTKSKKTKSKKTKSKKNEPKKDEPKKDEPMKCDRMKALKARVNQLKGFYTELQLVDLMIRSLTTEVEVFAAKDNRTPPISHIVYHHFDPKRKLLGYTETLGPTKTLSARMDSLIDAFDLGILLKCSECSFFVAEILQNAEPSPTDLRADEAIPSGQAPLSAVQGDEPNNKEGKEKKQVKLKKQKPCVN